jgi:hypothetical protein
VPSDERRRGWREPALLAAGAAYALGAATTSAFSWPADAVTAIPIVALVVLAVVRWPRRPQPQPQPQPQLLEGEVVARGGHPYRAWVVLLAVAVAWELAEYLARGSRGAHPTLSSMADALDRYYPLKALVFFGWLCLGACIVRRGAQALPRPARPTASSGPPGVR